jgi:hypothetical protein
VPRHYDGKYEYARERWRNNKLTGKLDWCLSLRYCGILRFKGQYILPTLEDERSTILQNVGIESVTVYHMPEEENPQLQRCETSKLAQRWYRYVTLMPMPRHNPCCYTTNNHPWSCQNLTTDEPHITLDNIKKHISWHAIPSELWRADCTRKAIQ